jgi:hypothetical protein
VTAPLALTAGATNITARTKLDSIVVTESGCRQPGHLECDVIDVAIALALLPKARIRLWDYNDNRYVFTGVLNPADITALGTGRAIHLSCDDLGEVLDTSLVPSESRPAETFKQRLVAGISTYGPRLEQDFSHIEDLAGTLSAQLYENTNLRGYIEATCSASGVAVDYFLDGAGLVNAGTTLTGAAPKAIRVGTPGTGEITPEEPFTITRDPKPLFNAVYIRGNNAAGSGWVTDPGSTSIADYGRIEVYGDAPNATTGAMRDAVGMALLHDNQLPVATGRMHVTGVDGWKPQQTLTVVSAPQYDINSWTTFRINTIDRHYSRGGVLKDYDIQFGGLIPLWSMSIPSPNSMPGQRLATGSVGKVQMDPTPPAVPTSLALTASIVQGAVGPQSVLIASLTQPADADTIGCWVELTSVAGPDWSNPQRAFIGIPGTSVNFPAVLPLTTYWARARAVDVAGNWSAYCGTVTTTMPADTVAPDVPTLLVAVPGFRGLGCAWDGVTNADLDHYELQFAPEDVANLGHPNTSMWSTPIKAGGTVQWVSALDPAKLWFVEVRAVDTSGNCSAWTAYVSGQPLLVGSTDISAASAVIDFVRTGLLTADAIKSGKLTVKASGAVAGIEVRDSDAPVLPLGSWDATGLYIRDPASRTTRWLHLNSGGLYLVTDGNESNALAAITPDGINAAAINFGTAQGGQNVVRNSSFERAPFLQLATVTLTSSADWTAAETANDNRTIASGSISVAAW